MDEGAPPRMRLEQVLAQRHMTVDEFRTSYERTSGETLSGRQAYRWVAGALRNLPSPRAQAALERLFGEPASSARTGRTGEARTAIEQASVASEGVVPDELDRSGGIRTFRLPRQLYYAADALRWSGPADAESTGSAASLALDAFEASPPALRAFGDQAGTRCALACARLHRGEIDGATEALGPVFELAPAFRISGVVTSVDFVSRVLLGTQADSPAAVQLGEQLREFGMNRAGLAS